MAFWQRFWGYIKTVFVGGVEKRMDPAVQIEQAVAEARKRDLELRNQAARVIAHRTETQMKLDRAVEESAHAKSQAGAALRQADAATQAGNADEAARMMRAAEALALKLESGEGLVGTLKQQFTVANEQAELAKTSVNDNAMQLEQLTAKRMELVGKLEQAKMQESVNKTLASMRIPVDASAPSIGEIEDKINRRMAQASAQAELESSSIEGAQRELDHSMTRVAASARLDSLRAELGLAAPPAEAAQIAPPADPPAQP